MRPDFTRNVLYGRLIGDPFGVFIEVKAVGEPLKLNYKQYQILGLIDSVANRAAGFGVSSGSRLLFITTTDTTVGPQDTLAYANQRRVSLWKAVACFVPGRNQLQVGPARQLNNVTPYGISTGFADPGVVNGLSRPNEPPDLFWEDPYGGY